MVVHRAGGVLPVRASCWAEEEGNVCLALPKADPGWSTGFPPEVFLEAQQNGVSVYCAWLCTIHMPHCGYQYKLYWDIVPEGQVEVCQSHRLDSDTGL